MSQADEEGMDRAVFAALPIPATLIDVQGIIIDVNPAFLEYARRVRGREVRKEERVGQPFLAFGDDDEEERVQAGEFLDELLKKGKESRLIWEYRDAANRLWVREIHGRPLYNAAGQPAGALILREDVTPAARRERQQQLLARVREAIWRMKTHRDLPSMLSAIREGLRELGIPFRDCGINLVDPGGALPQVQSHNMTPEGQWFQIENPEGEKAILRIWRSQALSYRPDLQAEDSHGERQYIQEIFHGPVRSVVDAPFSHGTLALNSAQPHAFSPEDLDFFQEIARVLSEGWARVADLESLEQRRHALEEEIANRRQAEDALRFRLELERKVYDISVHFIEVRDLDEAIETVLGEVGQLSGAGRAYLFLFRDHGAVMDNTHEWCAAGVTPEKERLQNLSTETFPWWMTQLRQGECIHVQEVAALPPEAEAEREILARQGIRSLLVMPVFIRGELGGFTGFDNVVETGEWDSADVEYLSVVADMIGQAVDRQRTAAALAESRARFERLADSAPDVVFRYRFAPAPGYEYINAACTALTGYPPEAYYADPLLGFKHVHPADFQRAGAFFQGQGDFAHPLIFRLRRKEGAMVWLEIRGVPIYGEDGALIALEGMARDITVHQQAEEDLRVGLELQRLRNEVLRMEREEDWEQMVAATQQTLRALVDFHGFSVSMVDVERNECTMYSLTADGLEVLTGPGVMPALRQVVESGQPLYRRNRQEMVQWGDFLGSWGDDVQSMLDVPFLRGTVAVNSFRRNAFSPRDIAVVEKVAQVVSQGYRRLEDLRALKATEEQFRQAQKLESIGQLAGGVAHDFNNLLTIIGGYSQILLRKQDPAARDEAEQIRAAAERGAGLVRQLLAFSRKQVLRPEALLLDRCIADWEKMLRRLLSEDIELILELDSSSRQIHADEGQLQQVLMNLAVNARDAMPEGGRLTLSTACVELAEGSLCRELDLAPGEYVQLAVSDTGVGMDAATRARIFEPFFTTKGPGKGTGLGLATVYGIVRQSGGGLQVESAPGQGSTFALYLPGAAASAPAPPSREAAAAVPSAQGETVLVVEDQSDVRRLVVQVLEEAGYTVLAAGDGLAALRLAGEYQGALHLLLTDVVMPGLSGWQLAETLPGVHPEVRVLYMSGYAEGIIDRYGVLEPGTALLRKPFPPDELLRQVRAVLDQTPS